MQVNSWLKSDDEDTLVMVKVKTRQNKEQFIIEDSQLLITVKDPPVKGKANKKIFKMFQRTFNTEIILESGQTSSSKIFRLRNISPTQVLIILDNSAIPKKYSV